MINAVFLVTIKGHIIVKITKLELFKVPPRWLFLKIYTDSGIFGYGEPVLEGKASTVEACVREMEMYLIGKNPLNIEDIWQTLYRGAFYRGGPIISSAISGIEQALWDIKGKFHNAPVYELLGGAVRNKIKVYGWIGGDRPSDVALAAKMQMDKGFTAIKMNATEEMDYIDDYSKVDSVLERVSSIREATNKNFGIAIDFHGRVHKPMAKILIKELEQFNPLFIEEPVLCENFEAFTELAAISCIPIATGERLYTRWDYKKIFEQGAVNIIQPDVSHAGGILECRKIAAMAEVYDMAVAPHCPLGPIALASCLQLDACTYNAVIQEQSMNIHYNETGEVMDYVQNKDVFEFKDGYVDIPKLPGLGVILDEEKIKEACSIGHNWKNPVWRYEDGRVAEW